VLKPLLNCSNKVEILRHCSRLLWGMFQI